MGVKDSGFVGIETKNETGLITTRLEEIVRWGRKNSLWPLPFGTACCAIEFMGVVSSKFDISRFGAELVRFSPRQSDMILVAGTINYKLAPVLKKIYDQIAEPKYVISMGACACSGGFYDNYATGAGHDQIIPVDVSTGLPAAPRSDPARRHEAPGAHRQRDRAQARPASPARSGRKDARQLTT
jgi:NADH-quinone oxidoreductase subunit B